MRSTSNILTSPPRPAVVEEEVRGGWEMAPAALESLSSLQVICGSRDLGDKRMGGRGSIIMTGVVGQWIERE